jgi:myo-inositol-1(or 4)-monophosphatase
MQLSDSDWSREISVAQEAAGFAAAILLQGWGNRPDFRFKSSDTDLVTAFDGQAEVAIVRALAAAFPDDGIVGEEGGGQAGRSGRTWHVDPLDGTTNFAHGLPIFATSIGLVAESQPVVGVVSAPAVGWTFRAACGQGAFLNDRPIHPSSVADLRLALLVTGFPYLRVQQNDNLPEFAAFMRASQGVRRLGSAALDLCFVACGWLDGFWERHIKSWDLAAGAAILVAAGGQVSDPGGGPFIPETGCILASNGRIHRPMLDELARVQAAGSAAFVP